MRRFVPQLIKILVFATVTIVLTGLLGATIANTNFGRSSGYTAVFTSASGLQADDDVRIVGVKVGKVADITVTDENLAEVRFDVDSAHRLPAGATATVKYRNLVGQRYLSIGTDVAGGGQLESGGRIPVERTQPALDLTVLFNGFKPLFNALDPKQVNQLSYEIIQVLQGEGGTIESLLSHTASVTSTIADKDAVIGKVIGNLNDVLGTLNGRGPQVSGLVDATQQLVTGLAEQRKPIGDAVSAIGDLTNVTGDLLGDARKPLRGTITELGKLSSNLGDSEQLLDHLLKVMPSNLEKFTRTLSYGSWFNYYLCGLTGTIGVRSLNITLPFLPVPATEMPERCKVS